MSISARYLLPLLIAAVVLATGCQKAFDRAVRELERENLSLTTEDFLRVSAEGQLRQVKNFIAAGFNVNEQNVYGRTALILAAENNHRDVVRSLLEAGADPTLRDEKGWTPLWIATYHGHTATVEEIAARTPEQLTRALIISSLMGHDDTLSAVLNAGADPNAIHENQTALMHAAAKGHLPVVRLLLERGADPTAVNQQGLTAELVALREGHLDVAQVLEHAHSRHLAGGRQPQQQQPVESDVAGEIIEPEFPVADEAPAPLVAAPAVEALTFEEFVDDPIQLPPHQVEGDHLTITQGEGRSSQLRAGDKAPDSPYTIRRITQRRIVDKHGDEVDTSEVLLQHEETGEEVILVGNNETQSPNAHAYIRVGDRSIRVKQNELITVPETGESYRVIDIRPTQIVIQDEQTREVYTIPKAERPAGDA